MPSQIKVDKITDLTGSSAVSLPNGCTIPSGATFTINGNININGVSTVGVLTATDAVVSGKITANKFVGDGSALTGVPIINTSKAIALALIK